MFLDKDMLTHDSRLITPRMVASTQTSVFIHSPAFSLLLCHLMTLPDNITIIINLLGCLSILFGLEGREGEDNLIHVEGIEQLADL